MTLKTLWTLICFNQKRRLQLQSPFLVVLCMCCYQQMYCLLIDWLLSTHLIASAKPFAIESCFTFGQPRS